MNWTQARKNLLDLAKGRRPGISGPSEIRGSPPGEPSRSEEGPPRALSVCVASGKGGTGKSVVSASVARLLSQRGRTLIVDADMGVGNAHILQDVSPSESFVDVVEGRRDVREVIVPCAEDLDLLAAGSGVPRMAELSAFELHLIATGLSEVETEYDYLLVDSAAGISRQTVSFAAACDLVLVVTTPDLTAMTDAYALLKVLYAKHPECRPLLLVNRAGGDQEAHDVAERIARVCTRFMGTGPRFLGWLPDDRTVTSCVNRRAAVVLLEPEAPFGQALAFLQERIFSQLELHPGGGVGRRLLQEIGYSPGMG